MTNFETGKHYEIGTPEFGQQPTVECVARTAKFVTFNTVNGEEKVKVQTFINDVEAVILGNDIVRADEARQSLAAQQENF